MNNADLRRIFYSACVFAGFMIGGYLSAMFVAVVVIMFEVTGE